MEDRVCVRNLIPDPASLAAGWRLHVRPQDGRSGPEFPFASHRLGFMPTAPRGGWITGWRTWLRTSWYSNSPSAAESERCFGPEGRVFDRLLRFMRTTL